MKIIKWKDTYRFWKVGMYHLAPELMNPISFKHVQFKYEETAHHIYGYDWLHKDEY